MKRFIAGLFFMVSIVTANAQFSSEVEVGAIGGFNFANVIGPDVSGNAFRIGLHLGAYSKVPLQNGFGIRPEIHVFSRKGTATGNYKSLYLDVPLLATYELDPKFDVLLGLQPSLLLAARVNDGRRITSAIRTFDVGIVAGGWYQFTDEFGFGIRFVPGIRRVGADGNESTYNFNAQLSVGYRFF